MRPNYEPNSDDWSIIFRGFVGFYTAPHISGIKIKKKDLSGRMKWFEQKVQSLHINYIKI